MAHRARGTYSGGADTDTMSEDRKRSSRKPSSDPRQRSGTVAKARHDAIRGSVFEADIMMQGYLEKLSSGMVKRWQSRYFELAGLYLKYFERAFPRTPDNVRGVIYLDELTSCHSDAENIIHLHFSTNKPIQLRARSRENADRWAEEINNSAQPEGGDGGGGGGGAAAAAAGGDEEGSVPHAVSAYHAPHSSLIALS